MKVQTARLRAALGKEFEWLFPDAQNPWVPRQVDDATHAESDADAFGARYFGERSDIEKKLAGDKPFVSWFNMIGFGRESRGQGHSHDVESYRRVCQWFRECVAKEAPVDLVVAFGMGAVMVNRVAEEFAQEGREPGWRMNMFFAASQPTATDDFPVMMQLPTLMVGSPADIEHHGVVSIFETLFSDLRVMEHGDGRSFPVTEPRATEIYARLVEETRAHFGLSSLAVAGPRGPVPLRSGLPQRHANADAHQPGSLAAARPSEDGPRALQRAAEESARRIAGAGSAWHAVLGVDPGATLEEAQRAYRELARLHQPERASGPGEAQGDAIFKRIQAALEEALLCCPMHRSGSEAVAAARRGAFTASLASGKPAALQVREAVRCAAVRRLQDWERRPEGEGTDPASVKAITPAELAELLLAGGATAIDTREPEEQRVGRLASRSLPGALEGLDYRLLRMMPTEAQERMAKLRDDDKPVVVASEAGAQCGQYCAMLIDVFGLEARRVCRLSGGLAAWEAWERECPARAAELRGGRGR